MIAGSITLEDHTIVFTTEPLAADGPLATYTVCDTLTGEQETRTVPMRAFMSALSIALHQDGDPSASRDYPEAESVQPISPALRFIP